MANTALFKGQVMTWVSGATGGGEDMATGLPKEIHSFRSLHWVIFAVATAVFATLDERQMIVSSVAMLAQEYHQLP